MPVRKELEIRLCERCWTPIPPDRACLVAAHPEPGRPLLRPGRSYRHLRDDPTCTGEQFGPDGGAAA
ncbi:hypothetical protein WY02_26500 [Pseudonocardia sp. AL041005-10]|nr:hypothetical protein WY02_26500 [Pseudonocardia sp. AL041005-10]